MYGCTDIFGCTDVRTFSVHPSHLYQVVWMQAKQRERDDVEKCAEVVFPQVLVRHQWLKKPPVMGEKRVRGEHRRQ